MVASKDPGKGHFIVSLVKSAVRMIGAGALMMAAVNTNDLSTWLFVAGVGFLVAEALGVLEELV
jgi:hypothetical protein